MISTYLTNTLSPEQKAFIRFDSKSTRQLLRMLDHSVLNNSFTVSLPALAKIDPLLVPDFTYLASQLNLGKVSLRKNFSNFVFNRSLFDESDIVAYRARKRLEAMSLRYDDSDYATDLVKRPDGITTGGLQRPAMMRSSKLPYALDRTMLLKYRRPILQNLIKSIKKGIELGHINKSYFADAVSYTEVANMLLDQYIREDRYYNSEFNVQDQRGRAIKRTLKRVGNYISSKDFRACLVVPPSYATTISRDNVDALNNIFLFIAELTGNKCLGQPIEAKIEAGRLAYRAKQLPRLDLKSTHGRDELHELIWLERIYTKLDGLYSKFNTNRSVLWDIPIEIDHTMSLAQIAGALLNDERVLNSTNVIGHIQEDAWKLDGVRRSVAKAYGTPTLYGSSQSVLALVKAKGLTFEQQLVNPTTDELTEARAKDHAEQTALKRAFLAGRFSVLRGFKDLLIRNYNVHTPIVNIDTGITQFQIHVSHMKPAGMRTIVTEAYTGTKFQYSFTKEPILVPDYGRMSTFWATCLVHHLDSDLMEYNLAQHPSTWALDIHDAILCLPTDATSFRTTASSRLKYYNTNRDLIMYSYLESIGATTPKAIMQHMKLKDSVVDAGDVDFLPTLMK